MKNQPSETVATIVQLPDRTQLHVTEIRVESHQANATILGLGREATKVVEELAQPDSNFSRGIRRLPGCRISCKEFSTRIENIQRNYWMPNESLATAVWNSHDWVSTRAAQSLVNQYADLGVAVITMDIRGRVLPGAGSQCSTTILLPNVDEQNVGEYLGDFLCGLLPPAISDTWLCLDFSQGRTPLKAGEESWCATGRGELPDGATKAITQAMANAELRGFSLEKAKAVLLSYTVSPSISINETWVGAEHLKTALPTDCHLLYTLTSDPALEMVIEATLIVSQDQR